MFRSGAYVPDDAPMVVAKLIAAAECIESLGAASRKGST